MSVNQSKRNISRIFHQHKVYARSISKLLAVREILAVLKKELEADLFNVDCLTAGTNKLYTKLSELQSSINVSGTINRDKMFYRMLDEFSPAPANLLGIELLFACGWPEAQLGKEIEIPITVRNISDTVISNISLHLQTPFNGTRMKVLQAPQTLPPGTGKEVLLRLTFSVDTPRKLAPVLISLTADRDGIKSRFHHVFDITLIK